MSALTTCIKKAGEFLHAEDRTAIVERAAALRKEGKKASEAAMQAVDERIAHVQALLDAAQPEQAQPKPATTIQDAGEKIGGARKDRWKDRGLNTDDLDAMSESEGAELATKANVWKPDWAALVDGGMNPVMAATVKVVYDRLAAQPKDNTPAGRRRYVKMMQAVRQVYGALTPENVDAAHDRLLFDHLRWTQALRGGTTNELARRNAEGIEDLAAHMKDAKATLFSVYKGRSDPFVIDAIDKHKIQRMLADGFPGKVEPWKRRLSLREFSGTGMTERGVELVVKDSAEAGTPLTAGQVRAGYVAIRTKDGKALAYAPTRADAEVAAKAVYERISARGEGQPLPERPHLDSLRREGLEAGIDRDATPQDLLQAFGFRGVEFGNWAAQDERQKLLNLAFDSLGDLATVLKVPRQALSLNGTLGMAFGARGGGRHAAHYEPGKLVINLTKLRGAGTLAHEWAHAFDHYLGELDRADAYQSKARGASGWYTRAEYDGKPTTRMVSDRQGGWRRAEVNRLDNLRPEMAAAINGVMNELFSAPLPQAEAIAAADAEVQRARRYLADLGNDDHSKGVYQRGLEQAEQRLADARAGKIERRRDSEFAKNARALDGDGEAGYWSRPTEMFARAFEGYVFDRLVAMGAKSDYLVHGVEADRYAAGYKGNPYPTGEDRARINAAFDRLVGVLKARETEKGVALFSRAPTFDAAVDGVLDGTKAQGDAVHLSQPLPILSALGFKDLPVSTTGDRIAKLHFDHGLTRAEIKRLPELLADPVMVFDSDTQPGSLVAVLDLWKNGAPVVAAIKPDVLLKRAQVNLLASAYPKDRIGVIGKWIDAKLLRYVDKDKTRAWATNGGVQFPWLVQLRRGSSKNILGPSDVVKTDAPESGGRAGVQFPELAQPERGPAQDSTTPPTTGLPLDTAQQLAQAFEDAGLHKVHVARTLDDLPAERKDALKARSTEGVRGIYFKDTDEVWVIADQVHSAEEFTFVVLHEAFHRGLRSLFGAEARPLLQQMWRTNQKLRQRTARIRDELKIGQDEAIEEALADMAGEGELQAMKGWPALLKLIRGWLAKMARALGVNLTFSDSMIETFVAGTAGTGLQRSAPAFEDTQPAVHRIGDGETPAFSRSLAASLNVALNDAREVKLPAGYVVGDLFDRAGTLHWWHKSVGTMHNLAERNPLFKRVFDGVQAFTNDTSYYATEAADLAPTILPKLETWRDLKKQPLSAEDTKAIAAPIFEGTLTWTRGADGKPMKMADREAQAATLTAQEKAQEMLRANALDPRVLRMWQGLPLEQYEAAVASRYDSQMLKAGIVWSDDELRSQFKLDDRRIGLYHEFRRAVDQSLDSMTRAEMVKLAGADAARLRERVLGMPADAAALTLRDHLFELANQAAHADDKERAKVLNDTADRIMALANRLQDLKAKGYAPLSRFGSYTLDVVGANGERLYFGLFETPRERARMMRRMQALHPDAHVATGTVSQEEYKLFSGVTPETLALFGDLLGFDASGDSAADAAFQMYLQMAKSNRSAMKRLIHRQGIAGFSEDAGRVLAGFVYSNARQTAAALHMGEVTQAAADIPKGQGELKDAAIRLTDYVKTPQEEAQKIRGLLFAQYLGGSVASAMVNALQPVNVTFPYLSQFGGVKAAAGYMRDGFALARKKATGDAELDAALKKAEEEGIVAPQEVHQLQAQAAGRGALVSGDGTRAGDAIAAGRNALRKLQLAWGKVFSLAEQWNRRVTFIAAYKAAQAQGMPDAAAFAEKAVADTQFVYGKHNKPQWARGAVGSVLFTFKQYSISYLELLNRMWHSGPEGKKAALLSLAVLFLMSGADGLPFEDDMEDVLDGFMQRLGYNFSSKEAKRKFVAAVLGKDSDDIVRFLEHGISGLPGVPIDVSGRLGMGNLIPGTGLLTKKQDHTRDLAEVAGPVADLGRRAFQGLGQLVDGDPAAALASISPLAARNAIKALDMANTGMYRDDRGRKVIDVDGYEALMKGIGFQPADVARVQQGASLVQQQVGLNKLRESEIADQWAIGIFENDPDQVRAAREALARWNADNPDSPIRIGMPQVLKRVRSMRQSKAERIEKSAPSEIRRRVRMELAGEPQ